MNEITVADKSVRVVEYRGQRVVTFAMIDAVHQRPEGTAKRTFNDNRERFIEGEDFFALTADAIRTESLAGVFPPRTPSGHIFTESGYLMLTKTFSDDLAWQVQRQLVNRYFRNEDAAPLAVTGRSARPLSRNQVAAGILLLRSAAEDLKLAPSAVLGGYQRLEAQLGVAGLLPAYAIDAPASSASGSSEPALAVGELLERHSVSMSAVAFNRLLMQSGFLAERERPSSKGGIKKFKVVTDLEYGKNATHPSNQKETQPLWYPSKFNELLELVLPSKPEAVA